jgi:hypothetical protein
MRRRTAMKLLCDHAAECGQRCKHAVAHESCGAQCEGVWFCVHIKAGERTVCKPLEDKKEE